MLIIENLEIVKIINYLYTHLPWDKHFIIFLDKLFKSNCWNGNQFSYICLSTYIPNSLEIQN